MTEVAKYQLLDGNRASEAIRNEITKYAKEVKEKRGRAPHLAAVLVGNDGASKTYVNAKVKACESVGFHSTLIRLPESTNEDELLARIKWMDSTRRTLGI